MSVNYKLIMIRMDDRIVYRNTYGEMVDAVVEGWCDHYLPGGERVVQLIVNPGGVRLPVDSVVERRRPGVLDGAGHIVF